METFEIGVDPSPQFHLTQYQSRPSSQPNSSGDVDFLGAAQKGVASLRTGGMAKSYTELAMLGKNLGSEKTLGT